MYKLYFILVMLITNVAIYSQEDIVTPIPEITISRYEASVNKNIADDKAMLSQLTTSIASLSDPKIYKDWTAWDESNKDYIKFENLDEVNKQGFYLYRAEVIDAKILSTINKMQELQDTFIKFKQLKESKVEDFSLKRKAAIIALDHFDNMIPNLYTLRSQLFVDRINLVKKMQSDYVVNDDKLKEELGIYLSNLISAQNDLLKLIEDNEATEVVE